MGLTCSLSWSLASLARSPSPGDSLLLAPGRVQSRPALLLAFQEFCFQLPSTMPSVSWLNKHFTGSCKSWVCLDLPVFFFRKVFNWGVIYIKIAGLNLSEMSPWSWALKFTCRQTDFPLVALWPLWKWIDTGDVDWGIPKMPSWVSAECWLFEVKSPAERLRGLGLFSL